MPSADFVIKPGKSTVRRLDTGALRNAAALAMEHVGNAWPIGAVAGIGTGAPGRADQRPLDHEVAIPSFLVTLGTLERRPRLALMVPTPSRHPSQRSLLRHFRRRLFCRNPGADRLDHHGEHHRHSAAAL